MIAKSAKPADYQITPESRQALEDLALTRRVEAHLLSLPRLRDLPIGVRAMQGEVSLSAIVPHTIAEVVIADGGEPASA